MTQVDVALSADAPTRQRVGAARHSPYSCTFLSPRVRRAEALAAAEVLRRAEEAARAAATAPAPDPAATRAADAPATPATRTSTAASKRTSSKRS